MRKVKKIFEIEYDADDLAVETVGAFNVEVGLEREYRSQHKFSVKELPSPECHREEMAKFQTLQVDESGFFASCPYCKKFIRFTPHEREKEDTLDISPTGGRE